MNASVELLFSLTASSNTRKLSNHPTQQNESYCGMAFSALDIDFQYHYSTTTTRNKQTNKHNSL